MQRCYAAVEMMRAMHAQVHLAAAANSMPVVRLLMEAWARRELAVRGDAAGIAGSGGAAGGRPGDPRLMRTWSGLRPVDVALTYGAAPGIVRVRGAGDRSGVQVRHAKGDALFHVIASVQPRLSWLRRARQVVCSTCVRNGDVG